MKEIRAVIQPARLARLREAFRAIPDFPGMTVTRAEGSGYHPGTPQEQTVRNELTDYSPRVRIEIVAPDEQVDALLRAIHDACHTGEPGDGVAWVIEVDRFFRVRSSLSL